MKKRILPVAVLLIVAMAVFMPQLLYYYSDTSYLNQVKYSDKDTGSVNLEMASTAKTKTIDQKLEDLNSIITDIDGIVLVNFSLTYSYNIFYLSTSTISRLINLHLKVFY